MKFTCDMVRYGPRADVKHISSLTKGAHQRAKICLKAYRLVGGKIDKFELLLYYTLLANCRSSVHIVYALVVFVFRHILVQYFHPSATILLFLT